ncbi:hypothetical protein ACFVS2_26945 [Brevibacillus sp. NPDC058079]|uniref:hypothetical protein n=1 Tax=Brevibacillus sp. NPDC058079 TaxID=3346330 RepID=UPI0036EAE16C
MVFKEKDIVYRVPIRFWEDKEPTKCIVQEEIDTSHVRVFESSSGSVYVYSEEYGHNVYVNRKYLFFSEKQCREAIELYSKLLEVYHNDESDKIFERFLEDEDLLAKSKENSRNQNQKNDFQ